jgi:molecular chaperone GrpE
MDQETKTNPEKETAETKQPEAEKKETKETGTPAENTKEAVSEKKPDEEKKEEKADPVEQLKKDNAALAAQVAVLKNEYAKAYADTENMKKRLDKEHQSFVKYHIQSFALEILPVLDNCERALAAKSSDEAMKKGVQMIYDQLKAALKKEGVEEIDAEGKPFDGNWHQALMTEHKDGVEPGMVLQVLQKGYKLKDRILRAAMVKVSE